ncbi:MAG: hypothetical protein CMJ23_14650 [Phycisphaerae bacterium]|nr:hypothetical protein [Phycisphaerae bacterium]
MRRPSLVPPFPSPSFLRSAARLGVLGTLSTAAIFGCSMVEEADRENKVTSLERRNFEIDVQPIMRNTIASEAVVVGDAPTVVRGYGLVVGLRGTGSRDMPAPVRAWMLQEMARRGVGNPATGFGEITPERMLDSDDTAIVIVEGVIPPGGVKGGSFDLRVYSAPGTSTTSLEHGRLYTTNLRPGQIQVGSKQASSLAIGRGNVFINPFAEPDANGRDTVDRLTGRILDGGVVDDAMPLKLRLAVTSHTRAAALQDAINSRYPREPGQRDKTAHGKSGEEIEIVIPPSHHKDPASFVELIKHTGLRPEAAEATALAIKRSVIANPGFAEDASWRWQAVGTKSIPVIQDLYDYSEESPRLAALTAGAALDDAATAPHLIDIANNGSDSGRLVAIKLLSDMGANPAIEVGLRPLLDHPDVDVRLAAFDALEQRRDPIVLAYDIDEKFTLNLVPSESPMIYVAQTGEPRIVVFGDAVEVDRPMFLEAWSDRLLMKSNDGGEKLEIFYREAEGIPAQTDLVEPDVAELIAYMGHKTTIEAPAPGIGLSYGETIGALHQLWRSGYIKADFKAEQDRVLAAILRAQKIERTEDRPEFDADIPEDEKDEDEASTPIVPVESGRDGRHTVPR